MWQKREYWEGLKEKWDIRSPGSGCADLKFVEKNDLSKKKNLSKKLFVQLGASSPAIHGGAYFSAVCG